MLRSIALKVGTVKVGALLQRGLLDIRRGDITIAYKNQLDVWAYERIGGSHGLHEDSRL